MCRRPDEKKSTAQGSEADIPPSIVKRDPKRRGFHIPTFVSLAAFVKANGGYPSTYSMTIITNLNGIKILQ